ncbi:MAG: 50S ribosomal protein L23 [Patescibacteria group bacterium]
MGLFGTKRKEEAKKDEVSKIAKAVAKSLTKVVGRTSEKTSGKEASPKSVAIAPAKKSSGAAPAGVAMSIALNENNRVILRPRITEKATLKADAENVFVFEIAQNATKLNVRKAVASIYNVVPLKVSIARNPSKKVFSRGKRGVVSGVKKAYVYLKEGDKIEII